MSVDVVTFGCRLNTYESEVIRIAATDAGIADAVVVNTCAVTSEAVRQARQSIRRLKRERPDAQIVVTGCAAQTEPQTFDNMPEVALVVGNEQKISREFWVAQRDTLRASFGLEREEKSVVNDIMAVRETALHLVEGIEGHARAFIQIQNGCDHRCTFCIIPFGRGNSRSVPMGEVVDAGAPARRERLSRGGAHRRRHHELRVEPARRAAARQAGAADPAARAGAPTPAHLVDRLGRGRRRPARCAGRGAAADAASASLAAAWRRPDPQAHEAAPFARRRHPLHRAGAAAAPRHRVRRRHHRGLPDRDRRRPSRARATSSTNAASPTCMCSPIRRGPARPPPACRRCRIRCARQRAALLRQDGQRRCAVISRRKSARGAAC